MTLQATTFVTHTWQVVVTTRELNGVFLQVDDNFLNNLLRQHTTLQFHVIIGCSDEAGQRPQCPLTHCLVFVLDWQLLSDYVPVQQGRQFTEVGAHVRNIVQRDTQLSRHTMSVSTMQYNKNICITHSGRLLSRIWGAGSRRAGRGGYTLRVVKEARCVWKSLFHHQW